MNEVSNDVARLRAISDYNKVVSTKADTKDPHELVKLLFEGLTDRIARKMLQKTTAKLEQRR